MIFIFLFMHVVIVLIFISIYILFNKIYNNIKYKKNKYVCMYAYYEKDYKHKHNLNNFLENGLLPDVDYYIIIKGECTLSIPSLKNVKVINLENDIYEGYDSYVGYDFVAWNHCINNYIKRNYDYYIFINTSVKGPYLKNVKTHWVKEFIKLFNKPDVKLVGTTINIFNNESNVFNNNELFDKFTYEGPYTHVQSMFFILNKDGFKLLEDKELFNLEYDKQSDVILNQEIAMSQHILQNGWNINCILPKYKDYDYRTIKENFNKANENPYGDRNYFGEFINPYEVIFYKNIL